MSDIDGKLKDFDNKEKSPSLPTSKDVYHKIKMEFKEKRVLDSFVIGYEDRFAAGTKEIPFAEYVPGGGIPYDRICYFRNDQDMVWDRRKGVEKIGGIGDQQSRNSNERIENKRQKRRNRKNNETDDEESERQSASGVCKMEVDIVVQKYTWPHGFRILDNHCFRFDQQSEAWRDVAAKTDQTFNQNVSGSSSEIHLTVVSFNVLFGLYGLDVGTHETERIPLLLNYLSTLDAHIICLQEVTEKLLASILAEEWVQNSYYISECLDHSCFALKPYGQLIISKYPILECATHSFGPDKRILAADIFVSEHFTTRVANVHLTSTKRETDESLAEAGRKKRIDQLKVALTCADVNGSSPDVVIVIGDFNLGDDSVEYSDMKNLLKKFSFRDLWCEMHPNEPGYSYDPISNTLAAFTVSKHFLPRRLDRILLKNNSKVNISFDSINLIGTEPANAETLNLLFLSDHYGLSASIFLKNCEESSSQMKILEISPSQQSPVKTVLHKRAATSCIDVTAIKPVYSSTLCLLPSNVGPFYPLVQHIRQQFDPHCARWPPHINFLYPFVPDEYENFQNAKEILEMALAESSIFGEAFTVAFAQFAIFEHKSSSTVVLLPDVQAEKNGRVLVFTENKQQKFNTELFRLARFEDATFVDKRLNEMYNLMKQAMPLTGDNTRQHFLPHLSVATFKSNSDAKNAALTWQSRWQSISCDFARFSLMSRGRDTPFAVKETVRWCVKPANLQSYFARSTIETMREKCKDAILKILRDAGVEACACWFGSVATKTDSISSDADLCICIPEETTTVYVDVLMGKKLIAPEVTEKSSNAFAEAFPFPSFFMWHSYAQEESFYKMLRYEEAISKSVQVEVVFARLPQFWFYPEDGFVNFNQDRQVLSNLDRASLKSIVGIRDSQFLFNFLQTNKNVPYLKTFIEFVKKWAKVKRIDSHTFGYPPKIAWLVMAISVFHRYGEFLRSLPEAEASEQLIHYFFHYFGKKDSWSPQEGSAVTFGVESEQMMPNFYTCTDTVTKGSQHMCICGLTYPCSNYCRSITASTMAIVQNVLRESSQLIESRNGLLNPFDAQFFSMYPHYLHLMLEYKGTVTSRSVGVSLWPENFPPNMLDFKFFPLQLRSSYKWLESQVINLILQMEKSLNHIQMCKGRIAVHPFSQPFLLSRSNNSLSVFLAFNVNSTEINNPRLERFLQEFRADFDKWRTFDCSSISLITELIDSTHSTVQHLRNPVSFIACKLLM